MTNKEMKVQKFEIMINDLARKIGALRKESQNKNPLEILIGEGNDEFARIASKNPFDAEKRDRKCTYSFNEKKIDTVINICRDCTNNCRWAGCNLGGQMVFFGLIVLAIDSDSYNEKLNILTDFAYLIGFDENMITDWIYTVKAILSAEKIDFSKIKSDNSKYFFENLA